MSEDMVKIEVMVPTDMEEEVRAAIAYMTAPVTFAPGSFDGFSARQRRIIEEQERAAKQRPVCKIFWT